MAVAETAKLIAALEFKDNFSPGARKAMQSLGKLESTGFRVGQQIGKGLNNAATNIKRLGVVAAAGIGVAVHQGIESLATLEDAETSVAAALKQMGLAGQVTAAQVAGWANQIESDVHSAFDDKDITQAATTLIRYGKVTAANLKPALVVMTDLAAKTGSVESASTLLAKALADPAKAAGKLSRVGVVLTKQQQDQIKALVKAGKVTKAQALLLDILSKSTKGAADASQGPYRKALSTLSDVTEDAQRALATGFLPVITKVADILKTELAKPETLNNIRKFGETLAGGLDSLIGIARNLPWDSIANAFKIAGAGAKAILDAFVGLPSWVQTAVLTGWGLNKLTGGALGGIVGELAKGLIKGVLGINAGVVNINAGVVNGAGAPGVGGAAGGGSSLLGKVGFGAAVIGAPVAVGVVAQEIRSGLDKQADALREQAKVFAHSASPEALAKAIAGTRQKLNDPLVQANAGGSKGAIVDVLNTLIKEQNSRATAPGAPPVGRDDWKKDIAALDSTTSTGLSKNIAAGKDIEASVNKGADGTANAVAQAKTGISSSVYSGSAMVAGAVRASRPIVTTNVNVSVTPQQINRTTTIVQRYGPTNGSSGGGGGGAIRKA